MCLCLRPSNLHTIKALLLQWNVGLSYEYDTQLEILDFTYLSIAVAATAAHAAADADADAAYKYRRWPTQTNERQLKNHIECIKRNN